MKYSYLTCLLVFGVFMVAPVSGQSEYLEKPVCGDDSNEILVEEVGEARNSERYDGEYGCTYTRSKCLYRGGNTDEFYDRGEYRNANEADEQVGRLKNDAEYCGRMESDPFGTWYDQDYGDLDGDGEQETCSTNTLYRDAGVRWFDSDYVNEYPESVTGGIDDDWNPYLEQKGHEDVSTSSPVSTGTLGGSIATLGFCGGDDESEYLITQRCETRFCGTDNSIQGIAEDPEKCILDETVEGVDLPGNTQRDLFEQGELVDVNTGSDIRQIACYNGAWYSEWPVVFLRDSTEVPLGTTDRVSFQVINVQEDAKTFDLELSIGDNDMDSLTTFTETDTNEMTVDVGGSSSETYSVEIRGNTIIENPKNIELQAESRDGSLEGYDTLQASVVDNNVTAVGNTTQERRDVPGIGLIQIAWLVMTASAIFFLTGRNL